MSGVENATFHSFKPSGKWYATGRGYLSKGVFGVFETFQRRSHIVADNDGRYPGLGGPGASMVFVVIPDEDCDHGYPLMLREVE